MHTVEVSIEGYSWYIKQCTLLPSNHPSIPYVVILLSLANRYYDEGIIEVVPQRNLTDSNKLFQPYILWLTTNNQTHFSGCFTGWLFRSTVSFVKMYANFCTFPFFFTILSDFLHVIITLLRNEFDSVRSFMWLNHPQTEMFPDYNNV